jgi:hypothetical protein
MAMASRLAGVSQHRLGKGVGADIRGTFCRYAPVTKLDFDADTTRPFPKMIIVSGEVFA